MKRNAKTVSLVFFILCSLCGATGEAQEQDERATLRKQQQALHAKVGALKREQDFLLFQKEMYATDSRYLVLRIRERSGQLKYKNRVLKNFQFTLPKTVAVRALQPGMLVLTKKTEKKKNRYALLFGTTVMLQWKQDGVSDREAGIPVFSLDEKDMASLFYAVEQGAPAYLPR